MSKGKNRGWGRSPKRAARSALRSRYRNREVSSKTANDYELWFSQFADYMRAEHNLCDINDYETRHLVGYGQKLSTEYSAATCQSKVSAINSVMRTLTFCEWKSVSPSKSTGTRRKNVRKEPHQYIEPETLLEQLRGDLPGRMFSILSLMTVFGLRLREAISIDIHGALKECKASGNIDVIYGTKSGRGKYVSRLIPVQRLGLHVLEGCLPYVGERFSIIPDDMGLNVFRKQVQSKLLPLLEARYGITIHGLRHEYAARRYLEITGCYSPVNCLAYGHALPSEEEDRRARAIISAELGHSRESILNVYIGSYVEAKREK